MGDIDETVLGGRTAGPSFDFGPFYFDGPPTPPTYEVVVMIAGGAAPVEGLAIISPEGVELTVLGEGAKLVIDGGEPDVLADGSELAVEILGRPEPAGGVENGGEGPFLPCRAVLGRPARHVATLGSSGHGSSSA